MGVSRLTFDGTKGEEIFDLFEKKVVISKLEENFSHNAIKNSN